MQQLRACVALAEDPGSVPNTHVVAHMTLDLKDSAPSLTSADTRLGHSAHAYTQAKYALKKFLLKKLNCTLKKTQYKSFLKCPMSHPELKLPAVPTWQPELDLGTLLEEGTNNSTVLKLLTTTGAPCRVHMLYIHLMQCKIV